MTELAELEIEDIRQAVKDTFYDVDRCNQLFIRPENDDVLRFVDRVLEIVEKSKARRLTHT